MLKVINVTKSFQSRKVLRGIDFELNPSELLIITGQNGSGKSTLLKILAGLISLDDGNANCFGVKFKETNKWKEQVVFQSPELTLSDNKTVEKTLDFYKQFFQVSDEKYKEVSSDFRVSELLSKTIENLSTGELRRLSLCLCFMREAKLQLFDEPLVNLDTNFREIFLQRLKQSQNGRVTLITTHHPEAFVCLNSKFSILKDGFLHQPNLDQSLSTENILEIINLELSG